MSAGDGLDKKRMMTIINGSDEQRRTRKSADMSQIGRLVEAKIDNFVSECLRVQFWWPRKIMAYGVEWPSTPSKEWMGEEMNSTVRGTGCSRAGLDVPRKIVGLGAMQGRRQIQSNKNERNLAVASWSPSLSMSSPWMVASVLFSFWALELYNISSNVSD